MKKRIFCTVLVLFLIAAVACTEADIQNIKNGTGEVIVLDTDNLPAPDIKKTNTENEINTENGDKDTVSEDKSQSTDNDIVTEENNTDNNAVTEDLNTDNNDDLTSGNNTGSSVSTETSPAEEEKPSLDDYLIKEAEGEYVLIKSAVVRSGPSSDFDKLGQLQADTVVEISGTSDNGWFRFEFDSVDGYINQKFFMDKETYDEALEDGSEDTPEDTNQSVGSSQLTLSEQIVALCNEYRAAEGLDPLLEDPELDELAKIRADEIIIYFEHERPDGSDCFTVMKDYKCTLCGENIAAGQGEPKDVVEAWMNSPGHRDNIMNKDFKKIGIGYCEGGEYGAYWAQLFAD
ncbi:MAG: SH3 domain-containing protein [Lachnospiraceae bacterium]|nr:SH3 domain-containing protein [Lachnospiraceae bacterium]